MDRSLTIECMNCGTPLRPEDFQSSTLLLCPRCPAIQMAEIFPAFYRKPAPAQAGAPIMVEGESSCFYHPQKKAAVTCDGCGRFLCALCEVEYSGQHLCPACIEAGQTKKKIATLETKRVLYDDIALSLAILPVITVYLTLFTAPAALYYSIRYWNSPRSILPRTRVRFMLAIVLALLQIGGWIALGCAIYLNRRNF